MLVVHVIRKPLSEGNVASNVLKWGTGALNIDASRIRTAETLSRHNNARDNQTYNSGEWKTGVFGTGDVSGGRWPANLILEHREGCECVGMQRVKGSHDTTGVWGEGGSKWGNGGEQQGYTDADGTETVPQWDCREGCPVVDLDTQSGVLQSGGKQGASYDTGQGSTACYGVGLNRSTSKLISDKGGASRYFKQIKE